MRTLIAIAFTFTSSTAFAGHSHAETDEEKSIDEQIKVVEAGPQSEFGIGLRGGSFHVADIYDIGFGFGVEGGVRIDRLAFMADYTLMGLSPAQTTVPASSSSSMLPVAVGRDSPATGADPGTGGAGPSHGGFVQRLGLFVRYSPARFLEATGGIGVRGDIFIDGGVGEQLVMWSGGGYLHRADISIDAGFSIRFRGPHHHGGYSLAARLTLASQPDGAPTPPAACAGPCDGPSRPLQIDRSVMGMFTAIFGG
jgi:hypothetical protein